MADGFKTRGGGSNPLNFDVVGNPQPTNPKGNTIWINTDIDITGYYFSATQPENMAEGEVWILIGSASDIAFSATKKNPVMVYPLSAKQKIDGALVDVTAKSYQNGEWGDWWNGELYDSGDEFESVTGGWIAQAVPMDTGDEPNKPSITKGSSSMTIKANSSGGGIVRTNNMVDITKYKSLKFNGSVTTGTNGHDWWFDFIVWSKIGSNYTQNVSAYKCLEDSDGESGTFTIDVSALKGNHYIGFAMNANADQTVVVNKMWLE
jgi:hypothetical protein